MITCGYRCCLLLVVDRWLVDDCQLRPVVAGGGQWLPGVVSGCLTWSVVVFGRGIALLVVVVG